MLIRTSQEPPKNFKIIFGFDKFHPTFGNQPVIGVKNWMRDYDPTLGRYVQADPLGLVDGASIYGYALQNPGRYIDPTGEFIPAGYIAAGAAIGAAIAFLEEYWRHDGQIECINWAVVGLGGAIGAFGGGYAYNAVKGVSWFGKSWTRAASVKRFRNAHGIRGRNTEVHHWIAANGRNGASWRHHPMNLRPLRQDVHRRIHGRWGNEAQFGAVRRWWYGTPRWAQTAQGSLAAGLGLEGTLGCVCEN